jgi:hypothetical protein
LIDGMRSDFRHALMRLAAGWLIVPMLLAACTANGGGSESDNETESETVTGSPAATAIATGLPGSTATADPVASPTAFLRPTSVIRSTPSPWPPAIEAAIDAAAREFGIERAEIGIETFAERNWPSTALGCPEPGRSYAQIITAGFRIVLRIDGAAVVYHADETGAAVVRCDEEERDEP